MADTDKAPHVVVCGAGLAGLSAAVSALEHGARVTVCEKAPEPGGTTVLSGGLLWTIGDYDDARAKVPLGDAALQWLVLETIEDSRAWLQGMGARLGPLERVLEHGRGQTADPVQLIELLAARLQSSGGTLRLSCGLDSLLTGNGAVQGLRVACADGQLEDIAADAVILATGGFQGNPELLARYVVRDPDNLLLRANAWSTGDGFLAATAAGAAASPGLDTFYGHALIAPPGRYGAKQLRDVSQYHGGLSVALNLDGVRFADEAELTGDESLNQRVAQQRGGRAVYIVDEDAMEQTPIQGRESITRSILQRARAAGGLVVQSDTLEGLCEAMATMGLPPQRALASLLEFNAHMQEGKADELRPARSRRRAPLARPPFQAVLVQAGITFTMGGLLVDERLRVLRRSGSSSTFAQAPVSRAYTEAQGTVLAIGTDYRQMAVPGLFAAGNDAGNISHFGYMGGLATALTTGRAAGRSAAGR